MAGRPSTDRGSRVVAFAGAEPHSTCDALVPLDQLILLPTAIGLAQQGQVDANLAVIIMGDSVVVVVCEGLTAALTSINLTHGPWVSSG